ncbi:hypothetical protein ACFWN7_16900 [Agromyces sp. NPDC058484]|uniref:hypothetical protein n=1 Tax=Agromyces sp. NPDC058484 TaxID=3346524 RepID=UPI00364BAB3D
MSTDEEPPTADAAEPAEVSDSTDAAGAPDSEQAVGAASADTIAELGDIESRPLAERAPRYQELADRLRTELEHSDPSRGSS